MMTSLESLYTAFVNRFPKLDRNGKIFFDHIVVQEGDEVVPPYIVFRSESLNPFFADNCVYFATVNNFIDVYTEMETEGLHGQIEAVLASLDISFSKTTDWDNDLGMYLTEYSVTLGDEEDDS